MDNIALAQLLQQGGKRRRRSSSKSRGGCPSGQIRRKGYSYVRDGKRVRVPSTCIKDRGKPGKGPKVIPPLKKGALEKFGYHTDESADKRHKALAKSVKKVGYAETIRRLNAVRVLNKNTNPSLSRLFTRDMHWVQDNMKSYSKSRSRSRRRSRSKSKSRKSSRRRRSVHRF